jgi:alkylation response protein AidB-like acyl-CoA dehydrogenase
MGDLVAAFEELGAALAPVPLFATVALATPVLLAAGPGTETARLLRLVAAGATLLSVADIGPTRVRDHGVAAARTAQGGWMVTGRSGLVVEADTADLLIVPAITGDGLTLFVVDATASEVQRRRLTSFDLTRGLAEVSFNAAQAQLIGIPGQAPDVLEVAWDLSCVVLAAEQVGGAQHCLDTAVAYAKERVQFGRPIGSFQSIKHRLVDLLLEVELARSALVNAVEAAEGYLSIAGPGAGASASADTGPDARRALTVAASVAKSLCSDAYMKVADESLHVHGGIGFTWEHEAHLYFRRAKSSQQLLGTPDVHRDRLSRAAGL